MLAVPAEQAANVIGQTVSICGKVFSAKFTGGSGVTFINMGVEYPNNPFTAVIMFKNRSNFTYKPEEYLNGKYICVTGNVIEYKASQKLLLKGKVKSRWSKQACYSKSKVSLGGSKPGSHKVHQK